MIIIVPLSDFCHVWPGPSSGKIKVWRIDMRTTQGVMHKNVVTVSPDDSLIDAYRLMKAKDIRHLPVLDKDKRLVGILSDRDLQRAMISKKISDFQQELHLASDLKVSDFMNWPVYTVGKDTPINKAAELILKHKVSALVVENDQGFVCGIVTTDDLLSYLVQVVNNVERPSVWPLSNYLY